MPSTSTFRVPKATITGPYGVRDPVVLPPHLRRGPRQRLRPVAQPQGPPGDLRLRAEGREVRRARPAPEDLRAARERRRHRLLVVPRLRLLPGPPGRSRRAEGPRGAPLARVGRLHDPRAGRHGVRRGDDGHPADGDRRDGRLPARPARRRGRRRADDDGGDREPAIALQRRDGTGQPGLLRGVRAAARRALGAIGRVLGRREQRRRDGCVRRAPGAAVHGRLRDARLRRRCRGRRPGDLAALGRRRRTTRSATRAPTWCGSRPGWRSTGSGRCRGAGSPTSARGCPSRCSPTGRRRRRRARRQRLDRDAAGAGDADADGAGGVRAARGLRPAVRRDRDGGREDPGCGAPGRPPGALPRAGPAAAAGGDPGRAGPGDRAVRSRPPRPATCSRCSTCSRPTSCWSPTAAATRRRRCGRSSAATRRCASSPPSAWGRWPATSSRSTGRPRSP